MSSLHKGTKEFDRYAWTKQPIVNTKLTFEEWWANRNAKKLPFDLKDILKEAWEAGKVNK